MTQSHKVYTEAYIVLEKFNLLNELPQNLQEIIKENYDNNIKFTYDYSLPLEYQSLSKDTRVYLTYLYMKYFCKSYDERKQYQAIVAENTKKEEQEKREKYNPDDIFKKVNKDKNADAEMPENNSNTELIEYKESFLTKFRNFIFSILHINKPTN